MNAYITILTLLSFSIVSSEKIDTDFHEFHISTCDIDYDSELNALQIAVHIFLDDLEKGLNQIGFDSLYLCTKKESAEADLAIEKYLEKKLRIKIDQSEITLDYLGKEMSDDFTAVWCYLEKTDIIPKKSIYVEYDLLMEIYEDQRNIVKVNYSKQNKSYLLFEKKGFSGVLIIK